MAFYPIDIKPGINKELPSLTSEPCWRDSNLIRFKGGYPQKMGGWSIYGITAGDQKLVGTPRSIHEWRTNNGRILLVVGTSEKLYLMDTLVRDITPLRSTDILNNAFDTTIGSTQVIVNHVAHGANLGDYVTFSSATSPALVDTELNANHKILDIINPDSYIITLATAATSTLTGTGGTGVTAEYEIHVGANTAIKSFGWSAGAWGIEGWGSERSISPETLDIRVWSLTNYGEDLVACHESSPLYRLTYNDVSPTDRAVEITEAPNANNLVTVTSGDRHLVTFGSSSINGDPQDAMLVRWADQETTNDWIPTAENTSGEQILVGGSRIVSVKKTQADTLIWTDTALHRMQYIGPPFTFGFQKLGANCGAIGKNSTVVHNGISFWMGDNDFYMYDGVVKTLPCTLHRYVFEKINRVQADKIMAGLNSEFHEVIWFYPSDTVTENDRYVVFNYIEQVWYHGELSRTSWIDAGLSRYPKAGDPEGYFYEHENGTSAAGSAMNSYIESGELDVDDGYKFVFIRRLLPDMVINQGSVDYIFKTRRYPHSTQYTDTVLTCQPDTEKLDTRIRTRQLVIRVESDEVNSAWRMGRSRIDIRPDGRR